MVGFETSIQFVPGKLEDSFIVESEMMEDGHRIAEGLIGRDLDIGKHEATVALGYQQAARQLVHHIDKAMAIDEGHSPRNRVNAEPHPGQIDEGHSRVNDRSHSIIGEEQLDAVLGHHRGAWDRVENLRFCLRSAHQRFADRTVDMFG